MFRRIFDENCKLLISVILISYLSLGNASGPQRPTLDNHSKSIINKITEVFTTMRHVVTVSGGANFLRVGAGAVAGHYNFLNNLIRYSYQNTSPNIKATEPMWGIFVGSEVFLSSPWALRYGLAYYQTRGVSGETTLTQSLDGINFSSIPYHSSISNQQLLAEMKLLWMTPKRIQPYFMLGLGAAFKEQSNTIKEKSLLASIVTPQFANKSRTNFSFAVGPGLDFLISKSLRVGVAYRYVDLGEVDENPLFFNFIHVPIDNIQRIHLYSQQLLLQITGIF